MNTDPNIATISAEMRSRHGCHPVILYGSRAIGDVSPGSDYDLAGFHESPDSLRDARLWNGFYLDLFIYPPAAFDQPDESLLKLRGGRVLFEKDRLGTELLARIEALFAAGPHRLPADEIQARKVWAFKMLDRAKKGDIEGHYRRAWLLFTLLEDYFNFRGQWYLGPKKSLAWLKENEPAVYDAFDRALTPSARIADIEQLAEKVVKEPPNKTDAGDRGLD